MSNRKLPFGYRMTNGKIAAHPQEQEAVRLAFRQFLSGDTFQSIADQLSESGTPYDDNKPWNKNMVARILGNEKYIGNDIYPAIIDTIDFVNATTIRCDRQRPIQKSSFYKGLRRLSKCKPTKRMESDVLSLLNMLITHSEMISCDPQMPNTDEVSPKLRFELAQELEHQEYDEANAKQLIMRIASSQLSAIGSQDYETVRIRGLLQGREINEETAAQLMQEIASSILVSAEGGYAIKLKNGQIIERKGMS